MTPHPSLLAKLHQMTRVDAIRYLNTMWCGAWERESILWLLDNYDVDSEAYARIALVSGNQMLFPTSIP